MHNLYSTLKAVRENSLSGFRIKIFCFRVWHQKKYALQSIAVFLFSFMYLAGNLGFLETNLSIVQLILLFLLTRQHVGGICTMKCTSDCIVNRMCCLGDQLILPKMTKTYWWIILLGYNYLFIKLQIMEKLFIN